MAASSCSRRSWLRAFAKTSTGALAVSPMSGSVGSAPMGSVTVRPVRSAPRPEALHRPPLPPAPRAPALGAAAEARAPAVPQPPHERLLQPRRGRVLPRPSRGPGGGPDQRPGQPRLQRVPGEELGLVRLPRVRGGPRGAAGAARRRGRLAARARQGAHGRPGELRDERRERDPDRGLRPAPDDPAALAPALLPAADRGGGHDQGDGPADVEPRGLRPRQGPPGDLRAGREGRERARDPGAADAPPAAAQGHGRLRRGLQRGLVEELGLRARTRRRTSTPTPRSCSSSSTRTGS